MAYLIALDDGHGMETAGKRTPLISEFGRFVRENEFNRAVVAILDKELQRCGFKTLLVAPTDKDTPLEVRTTLANNANADAYVAIHYNAFDGTFAEPNPEGLSVHIYPSSSGRALGNAILKYLRQGTPQVIRGIKESPEFWVLRKTKMVAVLSENGFMDNKKEAMRMLDPAFQKEVAVEHAMGICEYFKVPYVPEAPPKPVYRVIVDGKQIGAFGDYENIAKLVVSSLGSATQVLVQKV